MIKHVWRENSLLQQQHICQVDIQFTFYKVIDQMYLIKYLCLNMYSIIDMLIF